MLYNDGIKRRILAVYIAIRNPGVETTHLRGAALVVIVEQVGRSDILQVTSIGALINRQVVMKGHEASGNDSVRNIILMPWHVTSYGCRSISDLSKPAHESSRRSLTVIYQRLCLSDRLVVYSLETIRNGKSVSHHPQLFQA